MGPCTQAEAERKKRAQILESEGQRQSKINVAEGEKAQVILTSEAAKQDAINRAMGAPISLPACPPTPHGISSRVAPNCRNSHCVCRHATVPSRIDCCGGAVCAVHMRFPCTSSTTLP